MVESLRRSGLCALPEASWEQDSYLFLIPKCKKGRTYNSIYLFLKLFCDSNGNQGGLC